MVVDASLHRRMRTDMLLDTARVARVMKGALVLVVLFGFALGRPWQAAAVAVIAALVWAAVRWVQLGRSMRQGLAVGQRITVGRGRGDEPKVVVTDATGEVVLSRGSAVVITRFRGIVSFYGRQLSFVLPVSLLTDDEIAFLEGRDRDVEASPGALPLTLAITEHVQQRTAAAITRAIGRSADVLMPVVVALGVLVLGALARSGPLIAFACVLGTVSLLGARRAAARAQSMVRSTYPVGRTVRADVGGDSITTQLDAVIQAVRWETYGARRVTGDAVLLRRKGPFLSPDVFAVYPRELFDEEAVERLATAVPRTF